MVRTKRLCRGRPVKSVESVETIWIGDNNYDCESVRSFEHCEHLRVVGVWLVIGLFYGVRMLMGTVV